MWYHCQTSTTVTGMFSSNAPVFHGISSSWKQHVGLKIGVPQSLLVHGHHGYIPFSDTQTYNFVGSMSLLYLIELPFLLNIFRISPWAPDSDLDMICFPLSRGHIHAYYYVYIMLDSLWQRRKDKRQHEIIPLSTNCCSQRVPTLSQSLSSGKCHGIEKMFLINGVTDSNTPQEFFDQKQLLPGV